MCIAMKEDERCVLREVLVPRLFLIKMAASIRYVTTALSWFVKFPSYIHQN